jgi:hypothetical protein
MLIGSMTGEGNAYLSKDAFLGQRHLFALQLFEHSQLII